MKLKDYEYFKTDLGVLYMGDCLEIMPLFEDNYFDLCLTDPPWNMNYFNDDNKGWADYIEWLNKVLFKIEKVSKSVAMFQSTKSISIISHLFKGYEYIAAVKNFSQMTRSKLPNCWDIVYVKYVNYCENGRNWFLSNTAGMRKERTDHPTPRGMDVVEYILRLFTNYNSLVLDCFAGSGTTGIACERLNRRYVLIENKENYCKIIKDRLQAENKGITIKELKAGQKVLF